MPSYAGSGWVCAAELPPQSPVHGVATSLVARRRDTGGRMERLRGAILVAAVGLAVALVWITSAFAARSLTAMDPVDGKQVTGAGIGSFKLLPAGSALPSPNDCASAVHRSSWEWRPGNQPGGGYYPNPVGAWGGVAAAGDKPRGRATGD